MAVHRAAPCAKWPIRVFCVKKMVQLQLDSGAAPFLGARTTLVLRFFTIVEIVFLVVESAFRAVKNIVIPAF